MNQFRISTVFRLSAIWLALCVVVSSPCVSADEWPQWRGPNRDGVWLETGIIETFPGPQLELKWRAPVSNGYSGPTVAGGRVYVTDRVTKPAARERVLCFDAATGAPVWAWDKRTGEERWRALADGASYSAPLCY